MRGRIGLLGRGSWVVGPLVIAQVALAQPGTLTVLELETHASAQVEVGLLSEPLIDSDEAWDMSMPFCEATVRALVPASGPVPRCENRISVVGNALHRSLRTTLDFTLERVPGGFVPVRSARGQWRGRMVFELHRPMNAEVRITQNLFREVTYLEYEPGRLTGPDGVVFEGSLGGGGQWVWQRYLAPGVYTFEAWATYDIAHAPREALRQSATHGMNLLVYEPDCPVDMDGDGQLTIFDFLMFQNLFATGDSRADFDGDGELTIFDFLAYQNAFARGCE